MAATCGCWQQHTEENVGLQDLEVERHQDTRQAKKTLGRQILPEKAMILILEL